MANKWIVAFTFLFQKLEASTEKMKTRPSALGMSDPVMEFLGILETQEFPIILKLLKGTKGA